MDERVSENRPIVSDDPEGVSVGEPWVTLAGDRNRRQQFGVVG
jgi:hypothetical protein